MELEVGMYVRIQWGNGTQTISKCTNKVDMGDTQYSKNDFYIHTDKRGEVIYKSMIVKASHNTMKLIEVGDYVNGKEVVEIHTNWLDLDNDVCEVSDIKTIVTKEQFESVAYKIGD